MKRAAIDSEEARRLQKAYADKRRAWARAVGRPYPKRRDPRPPPGEIERTSDENE